jgi:hypothetical protein
MRFGIVSKERQGADFRCIVQGDGPFEVADLVPYMLGVSSRDYLVELEGTRIVLKKKGAFTDGVAATMVLADGCHYPGARFLDVKTFMPSHANHYHVVERFLESIESGLPQMVQGDSAAKS